MAKNGSEPAGAMGSDTPLAVLSHTRPSLSEYFKQMFAQVTNPPIDALREKIVTSTTVYVGAQGNLLEENADNCKVLKIENPILTETDLLKIKAMDVPGFKVVTLSICYYKNTDLEKAIDRLFVDVDRAYRDGANILILSDRDIDEYHVAIPSLLAVGAVSKYLVRTRKRTAMALILESGEPRLVHDFATLLGYGAAAINPYLAQETIGALITDGLLDKDYYAAVQDYNQAVLAGIVKIASKMGISTIQSYAGSQIFEHSASRKRSWTSTSRTPSPAWAASQFRTSRTIWRPAIRRPLTRWDWTSTASCRVWVLTSTAAAPLPNSTCTIRRPSTCCSRPAGPAATTSSSSTRRPPPMRAAMRCICAACSTSTTPRRVSRSTRSRVWTPS